MARNTARRPPAESVTPAAFAHLERSLANCTEQVEKLKGEIEIHIRRMAAMQAQIDHLNAQRRQT
jgi:hypothetical protein